MEIICLGGPGSHPTVEPGGNGSGVSLKAGPAGQLLLLKPADYDFPGDGSQWARPGPAERRAGVRKVRAGGGGKEEGSGGKAPGRMNEHDAHTHAGGDDYMSPGA